jgi:radical SAM superfamily enzyme YgiQ (UPF0313 family)
MKNILLISPDAVNEALWVTGDETEVCQIRNNFPPLGLATVAGLTPGDKYHVQLWDEIVHGRITADTVFDRDYHLVGVTGYDMHRPRQVEIANVFRARGVPVAGGGPGVSSSTGAYRPHFDILFVGEVENTWPQFLRDWEQGSYKSEYCQIDKPDLDSTPRPVWDSIANEMKHYGSGAVQTTRGCPYDCEFCDVIYLFGRRQRHRPIPIIIEELRELAKYGFEWVFFCDDEFGGDRKYAKELLREIIQFNATLPRPMYYSTQMCITASSDPEFCQLLAAANFHMVFIGIESANTASLKGANKLQNLRGNLVDNIHTLLSYGIGIRSGMIVGFDEDDQTIFDVTTSFLQKACLPSIGIYMLKAPIGTRLWMRLMRERRVLSLVKNKKLGPARARTNILPKQMSRVELYEGYRRLLANVYSWPAFADRICGFATIAQQAKLVDRLVAVDAEELIAKLQLNEEAAAATRRMLDHTRAIAPQMLKRVKDLIVQYAKYHETIQQTIVELDVNIERERSGDIILEIDNRAMPLPVGFREELNRVLPHVHRRIFLNLENRSHLTDALTEVFVEFLLRMGEGFESFGDHHYTLLDELCDRNCAKYNQVPAVYFVPLSDAEMKAAKDVPEVKRIRLVDDIYKSVFEKLAEHHVSLQKASDRLTVVAG